MPWPLGHKLLGLQVFAALRVPWCKPHCILVPDNQQGRLLSNPPRPLDILPWPPFQLPHCAVSTGRP
jgi:hypothetical protein